VAVVWR